VARALLAGLVSSVLDEQRRQRQREQLASLANVSSAFADANETEDVLPALATALANASGIDWVILQVYNEACDAVIDQAMNVARHSQTQTATSYRDRAATPTDLRIGVELTRTNGTVLLPDVFAPDLLETTPNIDLIADDLPSLQRFWQRAHILSMSLFPITFQGKAIGYASFSSSTAHRFDDDEVNFISALVTQASTAIHGLRLYDELRRSREELRQSEERFRGLVQHASDLITVIDADTTIRYQSPAIAHVLGHEPADVVGRRLTDLIHIDDVTRTIAVLQSAMANNSGRTVAETRIRNRNGTWRDMEFIGTDQRADPAIAGFVLNMRDVTERKSLEQQLRHQALHDPLTKLANRTRFADRLEHALMRAQRSLSKVAILFMDLDNFKGVNDSLGHTAGDHLLTEVAERVQRCLRPGDTVARLGGDEFAILLDEVESEADARAVADRIFAALDAPFELDGKEIIVRASIGIAIGGAGGTDTDADTLLRDADVAMYVAKSHGKGCYEVFERSMQVSMMERLELLADLQRAVERDEFLLNYQPMIELENGRLYGVEALVRWQHPRKGLIQPGDFISIAEDSGSILGLGKWVLEHACKQAMEWRTSFPESAGWTLSVNVSARQLQHPGFVTEVEEVLADTGFPAGELILEITESVMMQDARLMMTRLQALKDLGVRLAIDDFGTGYSSLSYLRQFPFDLLKIDKSFIDDVGAGPEQKELTRAIIELGKTLDLELVAEGIERNEQLSRLKLLDCGVGQGFFFAEPMDGAAVEQLLAELRDGSRAEEAA
jgi:diguanylate cyclase (GGDEF)-like protein/PAS domain S-box-containing protein